MHVRGKRWVLADRQLVAVWELSCGKPADSSSWVQPSLASVLLAGTEQGPMKGAACKGPQNK